MTILKRILLTPLLLACLINGYAQQNQNELPPGLDAYVNKVIQAFEVPGISLAIVKNGKVLLTKGYGVKEQGQTDRVDARTLFCIASNTKAFTATALGMLVGQGEINWDDPVINYLPWFRMSDPYVTSQLTIRDLLVHHSGLGLGAGDLLQFPPSDYSRKEIVEKLHYIPLKTSFRSAFAYDNILYLVAGEVIKAVSGLSWEDFIKTKILDKLGMNESIVRISQLTSQPNVAASNAPLNGQVTAIKTFPKTNLGDVSNPAGGISSNAVDMAKWLITQLDSGRTLNNDLLFHPQTTRELWSLVTPLGIPHLPVALKPLQMNFRGYGLGFFLQDYRGHKMVWHTGGLTGFVSRVTTIPDLKLGICILTNQESGAAFDALTFHILDYYLHAPAYDWIDSYQQLLALSTSSLEKTENKQQASRDSAKGPSLPLGKYVGTFHDAWYGDIDITMKNNQLVIQFTHSPDLMGDLQHWQYDTFVVRWRDRQLRADAFVTFSLNADGSVSQTKMKPFSPATDFSYDFQDLLLKPGKGR